MKSGLNEWSRIESTEEIMRVSSARPLEETHCAHDIGGFVSHRSKRICHQNCGRYTFGSQHRLFDFTLCSARREWSVCLAFSTSLKRDAAHMAPRSGPMR